MTRLATFPWRHLAPTVRHYGEARLRAMLPLLHTRLSVPCVVGIGAVCFCLPYVLWRLTPTSQGSTPSRTPPGVEIQHVLAALYTAVGRLPQGVSPPFALQDAEVTLHFVVQPGAAPGASAYRLVPVDTALQARPEHLQTVTLRLRPAPSLPTTREASVAVTPGAAPPEDAGLRPPALPKKRARP